MRFRTLDSNGDWNWGKGKNDYASNDACDGILVHEDSEDLEQAYDEDGYCADIFCCHRE